MLLINAKIYTLEDSIIENGFILIENDNIKAVGDMSNAPSYSGETRDLNGKVVIPGLIDAHTHLGGHEDSLGFEGNDINERTNPITPSMRILDGTNPFDVAFSETRSAGVTSVVISPGSANPIGGQMSLIKTVGNTIDEMMVEPFIAMKFAFGENPKRVYNGRNQTPVTRMGTASLIREALQKARDYYNALEKSKTDKDAKKPDFNMNHEALIPLFEKTAQAHMHAHRADDIATAIRIAEEFDINYVLVHATEAHLIPEITADKKMILGPLFTDRSKPELRNLSAKAPKIMKDHGASFAMTTDHPVVHLSYIKHIALICIDQGLTPIDALKTITIDAAKVIGFDHKIGSIKAGKDADLVVLSGEYFDYTTKVETVFINGKEINA